MPGHAIHPLLAPIGFTWQTSIALSPAWRPVRSPSSRSAPSMPSRETKEAADALGTSSGRTLVLGHRPAFLAWYVFAPQCVSTLGVVRRETASWLWPRVMFVYMVTLAYAGSFLAYHLALALGAGG